MMVIEQLRAERRKSSLPIMVKWFDSHIPQSEATSLENVSETGAFFVLKEILPTDKLLTLSILFEHTNIDIDVSVVRSTECGDRNGVGVRFV